MKIIALKYFKDGFMTQGFAFGGSRAKEQIEPVTYRSSLQNFLIDTGKEVILIDTGFARETPVKPRKDDLPLWMGERIATFPEALENAGYKPEDVSKVILTHKHPDHAGELRMFPHAKIYVTATEADAMGLTGDNIVRVEFTDGPYKNFPASRRIAENLVMLPAPGHTKGNAVAVLEEGGLFYMFQGDVTYCDEALKADELSVVAEDLEAARKTLDTVREFVQQNPTVYLSTHCPEGYENLEQQKVMKL